MNFLVHTKRAAAVEPDPEGVPYEYPQAVASRARWTLREMLAELVRVELAAYRRREAERGLIRILTADQIRSQVSTGKVSMDGREAAPPPVNDTQALDLACEAFTRGLYLVFADEQPVTTLDAPLPAREGTRMMFVMLTLLIGR